EATKALFAIRWKLGRLFGWETTDSRAEKCVVTLRERLPDDLQEGHRGPDFVGVSFHSVYVTDTESVCELANKTVHALMHIGWVANGDGTYTGQMTALVMPNGTLGKVYMTCVKPIRRSIVYPQLIRSIGRNWP